MISDTAGGAHTPPAQPLPRARSRRGFLRELLETLVLTVLIFLAVKVALQNFKVEGYSMEPSLHNDEYVLVNKVDYLVQQPHRGDIVVFHAVAAGEPSKDFIKRVIGLPGDSVAVHNGGVYVNGHRLRETYISQSPTYTFGPKVVPRNDYFVLGDNRNDSDDSHLWPTPWLSRHDIIGKAWVSYWPPGDVHMFEAALP